MKRFLWLWLTLLGAYWAARTAVSVVVAERVDASRAGYVMVAALPLLQALLLWWVTRARGEKAKDNKDCKDNKVL